MNWDAVLEAYKKEPNIYKKKLWWLLAYFHYCQAKLKMWLWDKNFNKTHISLKYSDGKIQITTTNHEDFVKTTQEKIDNFSKSNGTEKFIESVLKESLGGCNYVIFEQKENQNKFIQFWTGNKKLEFDFHAIKSNGLKKYYYSILGVLADQGFSNIDDKSTYSYVLVKNKETLGIQANFKNNIQLASQCTALILTKIYGLKTEMINVVVN